MKGKNYSYFENCYFEKNKPYIPVPITFKADTNIGNLPISTYNYRKDGTVEAYCLLKDLEMVSNKIQLEYKVKGYDWKEYLDWLHDGLCDEFGDLEVEKRSRFNIVNDMRERTTHKVIHYILDNIDKYCGYFLKTDCDYEWLYALYDDAKLGEIGRHYI